MKQGPFHLGLIGYPLGHSRSPVLHHSALQFYGLKGDYRLFPIQPLPEGEGQIIELLKKLRGGELNGLNVTIPHKGSVLPHLDYLSKVAGAIGAANTLYMDEQGRLVGENTDVPGFLTDLKRLLGENYQPGSALVFGAGGSARAIVYALVSAGWQVAILARHVEQAEQLLKDIRVAIDEGKPTKQNGTLKAFSLSAEALLPLAPDASLIVNTTPLGMYPHPEGSPWPVEVPFPITASVYDLVYNPHETELVRCARKAGLRARTGGGMLAAQAALSFALWTGREAPFAVMEAALM